LLRWAGLANVVTPDYHARREADIDRLAEAVEQHLDTGKLRSLFGWTTCPTVRGELVEPLTAKPEPFDKLRVNGNKLEGTPCAN
jgi:hypothetical protein